MAPNFRILRLLTCYILAWCLLPIYAVEIGVQARFRSSVIFLTLLPLHGKVPTVNNHFHIRAQIVEKQTIRAVIIQLQASTVDMGQFCVLIGYSSRQDVPILRDCPLWSRAWKNRVERTCKVHSFRSVEAIKSQKEEERQQSEQRKHKQFSWVYFSSETGEYKKFENKVTWKHAWKRFCLMENVTGEVSIIPKQELDFLSL